MTRIWGIVAVIASACAVAALASLVFRARAPTHTARATLVVPAGTTGEGSLAANPLGATQLAGTYQELLNEDPGLRQDVADRLEISVSAVRRQLTVQRPASNAGVLEVSLDAPTRSAAKEGLLAADQYLRAEADKPGALIARGSLIRAGDPRRVRGDDVDGVRYRTVYAVSATPGETPDALSANRLAANYSGLLLANQTVLLKAAEELNTSIDVATERLSASNPSNTSTIELSVSDSSYRLATRALLSVVRAVTGNQPVTSQITPGTLEVARLPEAEDPANATHLLPIAIGGFVGGLLLGIVALLAYNSRHPRLGSVSEARELLAVPVTDLGAASAGTIESLRERWKPMKQISFIPFHPTVEAASTQLADMFNGSGTNGGARGKGPAAVSRSFADAFSVPPNSGAESVVLVRKGDSLDTVQRQIAEFEGAGGRVGWLLLVPKDIQLDRIRESGP